eukprot:6986732-Prymnesium_polylepis.1
MPLFFAALAERSGEAFGAVAHRIRATDAWRRVLGAIPTRTNVNGPVGEPPLSREELENSQRRPGFEARRRDVACNGTAAIPATAGYRSGARHAPTAVAAASVIVVALLTVNVGVENR